MKLLLLTQGSRGDVEPFVALAKAAQDAGHEVVLGASDTSIELVRSNDVPAVAIPDVSHKIFLDKELSQGLQTNFAGLRGKSTFIKFATQFRSLMAGNLDELAAAAETRADLVVHHVNTAWKCHR